MTRRDHGGRVEQALLLIKPEGVGQGLAAEAAAAVESAGLRVACLHRAVVTTDQVTRGWADLRRTDHPLEHLILDLWFVGREVELLPVVGVGAIRAVHAVKARLRRGRAVGAFRNMVHTTDNELDYSLQLGALAGPCRRCLDTVPLRFAGPDSVPQAFPGGSLLPVHLRDRSALEPFVRPWWNDPASCFWRARPPEPYRLPAAPGAPLDAACLTYSPHHLSYDNLVAALLAELPGLDLPAACRMVFSAMHFGQSPLLLGGRSEVAAASRALRARGLGLATGAELLPRRDTAPTVHAGADRREAS
jgi:nucleoside diphosphate kinase